MDERTIRALNEINRTFYRETSAAFDATRGHAWPGWSRVADQLPADRSDPTRVLDVGCGNGRFGAFLADRWRDAPFDLHYTGIDSSAELLDRARERALPITHCDLVHSDLVEALMAGPPPVGPGPGYSLIGLFGVLHHIPSAVLRSELLVRLGKLLASNGLLALTCWQFGAFDRFRDKFVSWDDYNRTASDPIDTDQLELGDHLLPWKEDPGVRRYCHFTDELEIQHLLESNFEIVTSYTSDGRQGSLNRYFICRYSGARIGP